MQPGVGVLLGVGHPDEHVDQLEHPLGLDAVLHLPASRSRAGRAAPGRRRPSRLAARVRALDVVPRCRRAPRASPAARDAASGPQTAAVGVEVVGRRAPTVATSAPTRSLNRLDLPAAGGAGERDDGVVAGDRGPLADPRRPRPPRLAAGAGSSCRARRPRAPRPGRRRRRGRPRPTRPPDLGAHLQRAHRAAFTAAAAVARRLRLACRVHRHRLGTASNRACSAGVQLAARREQLLPALVASSRTAWSPKTRLEQPLGEHRRAAGDADLGAGQARGLAEHHEHQHDADPVDAVGQRRAPWCAGPCPRSRTRSSTLRPASRAPGGRPGRQVRRRPWPARGAPATSGGAAGQLPPPAATVAAARLAPAR